MTYLTFAYINDDIKPRKDIFENPYIRNHIDKITDKNANRSSRLAYSLLCDELKKHYNLQLSDLLIIENEFGKPEFADKKVHFNISHSKNAVACVLSDFPVGVDVEVIKHIRSNVMNKCFSTSERAYVKSPRDFYRIWTLKEAYVKCLGCGISRRLSDISFDICDDTVCSDAGIPVNYTFKTFDIEEHVISVCASDNCIIIE